MLPAPSASRAADENAPLMLARDGYFYVNAKPANVGGKTYVTDQMYVEERVPARRTHSDRDGAWRHHVGREFHRDS
jgi:hypothetical protein